MYFSEKSKKLLSEAHPDLQKIFNHAIAVTDVDFGISESVRSIERQAELVNQGKSKTMKYLPKRWTSL